MSVSQFDNLAQLMFYSPTFILQMKPCFVWQSSTFQDPVVLEMPPTIITQSYSYQVEKGKLITIGCMILRKKSR